MTDHEDIQREDIRQDSRTVASAETAGETAGQKLAATRESWGISVQEVAQSLNLNVSIIQAVEADDYDQLPGSTFARGYIRAYANLLRLNPDELIATLGVSPVQMMDMPLGGGAAGFGGKSLIAKKKRGFLFKFSVFVIVLLFAVLALFGLNHWLQPDLKKLVAPYQFLMPEINESNPE